MQNAKMDHKLKT